MNTQLAEDTRSPMKEDYTNVRWIIRDEYEGTSSRKVMYLHAMRRWKDVDRLHLYWTRNEKSARKFYTALEAFHARREIVANKFPHTIMELKIVPITEE